LPPYYHPPAPGYVSGIKDWKIGGQAGTLPRNKIYFFDRKNWAKHDF
jgi:hypothetical protein